jgi:hypothetical protein
MGLKTACKAAPVLAPLTVRIGVCAAKGADTPGAHAARLGVVALEREQQLPAVGVPELDQPILARGEHVVRARHERHLPRAPCPGRSGPPKRPAPTQHPQRVPHCQHGPYSQ